MSSVGLGCRGVVISINGMQILDASENQKARAKVNVDKQAVMKQGGRRMVTIRSRWKPKR